MRQKEFHTAQSLAEMIILATFIADTLMSTLTPNTRQKNSIKRVNNAREAILKRVTEDKNSDSDIYDASEKVFDKYFDSLSEKDFLFLCRGFLGVYLRNYHFGSDFFNLFKAVYKYSGDFAKGGKALKSLNLEFIKDIRGCTRVAELEIID